MAVVTYKREVLSVKGKLKAMWEIENGNKNADVSGNLVPQILRRLRTSHQYLQPYLHKKKDPDEQSTK
jgi:hypothetical protein